jgi:hypothetical protein
MSRAFPFVPSGTDGLSYEYATSISRTPDGTSTGRYTKSGAPVGRWPFTVRDFSAPSAARAKLTPLRVRALVAPATADSLSTSRLSTPGMCASPSRAVRGARPPRP